MDNTTIGNVFKIRIYPVKSGGPIELRSAKITPQGLDGDREFMVVSSKKDKDNVHPFLSQRDMPAMALLRPEQTTQGLNLSWAGKDSISVAGKDGKYTGKDIIVKVWDSITSAVEQKPEVNQWLSDHLGASVKLVRAAGIFSRKVSSKYLLNESTVRFQDAYPVHWFMLASVTELSNKMGESISWDRFRPNIVGVGGAAQVEHLVHAGTMGGIEFFNPKPCDRCMITTLDPQTGMRLGREPLATLNTYKRWRNKEGKPTLIFGENMLPMGSGEIKVGDRIVIKSVRTPPLEYG